MRNLRKTWWVAALCAAWIICCFAARRTDTSAGVRLVPGELNTQTDMTQLLADWEWTIHNDTADPLPVRQIRASCGLRLVNHEPRVVPAGGSSTFNVQYPASTRSRTGTGVLMIVSPFGGIVARRAFSVELPVRPILEPPRLALVPGGESRSVQVTVPRGDLDPESLTVSAPEDVRVTTRPTSANRWTLQVAAHAPVDPDHSKTSERRRPRPRTSAEITLEWTDGTRSAIPIVIEAQRPCHPERFLVSSNDPVPIALPVHLRGRTRPSSVTCTRADNGRPVPFALEATSTGFTIELSLDSVPEQPTYVIIEVRDDTESVRRLRVHLDVV